MILINSVAIAVAVVNSIVVTVMLVAMILISNVFASANIDRLGVVLIFIISLARFARAKI